MTVAELIEALSYMDQDAEVKFAYDYGDYWRTEAAADVNRVTTGEVIYSGYHRMYKTINIDDDRYDGEDYKTVVILK